MSIFNKYIKKHRFTQYYKNLSRCSNEVIEACTYILNWLNTNCTSGAVSYTYDTRPSSMGYIQAWTFDIKFYKLSLSVEKFEGYDKYSLFNGTYYKLTTTEGKEVPLSTVDIKCLKYVFRQFSLWYADKIDTDV